MSPKIVFAALLFYCVLLGLGNAMDFRYASSNNPYYSYPPPSYYPPPYSSYPYNPSGPSQRWSGSSGGYMQPNRNPIVHLLLQSPKLVRQPC